MALNISNYMERIRCVLDDLDEAAYKEGRLDEEAEKKSNFDLARQEGFDEGYESGRADTERKEVDNENQS